MVKRSGLLVPRIVQPKFNKFISSSNDGKLKVWDIENNDFKLINTVDNEDPISNFCVISASCGIIATTKYESIGIYDINNAKLLNSYEQHSDEINGLNTFDLKQENNSELISCSEDQSIKIWSIDNKNNYQLKVTNTFKGHSNVVGRVYYFSANIQLNSKKYILSCSLDSALKLWNIYDENNPNIKTYEGHTNAVICAKILFTDYQKTAGTIYTCSYDKTMKVWDLISTNCLKTIQLEYNLFSFSIIPETKKILVQTKENTLTLMNLEGNKRIEYDFGKKVFVTCIQPIDEQNEIISVAEYYSGKIVFFDLKKTEQTNQLTPFKTLETAHDDYIFDCQVI